MDYYKTSKKIKVENYPYGYTLKTDKYYSIEFKEKKGFRLEEQTLNPRTQKLNKPKKTTYKEVMLLKKCDDGKIRAHVESFYDNDGKDRGWKFMHENYNHFLQNEMEYIIKTNIMLLKADIYAKKAYCNVDVDKLMPLYENAMNTLVKMLNENINLWDKVTIDWEQAEKLEDKEFNPFKARTLHVIN